MSKSRSFSERLFLSVDIVFYGFGRNGKQGRIFNVLFPALEARCVLESVTDPLVGHHFHIYDLFCDHVTLAVDADFAPFGSVGYENGKISEIVDVVVYRFYAQRTHAGYDHGTMERADVKQRGGDKSEIIHNVQGFNGEAQYGARETCQLVHDSVESAVGTVGGFDLFYRFVELVVNVKYCVLGFKPYFDAGVGCFDAHGLLYRHRNLNVVSGKDPLTADKTVESGVLRHGSYVSCDYDVKHREVFFACYKLLANEFFRFGYVESFSEGIARIASLGHYERHYLIHSVDRAQSVTVLAISESALSLWSGGFNA